MKSEACPKRHKQQHICFKYYKNEKKLMEENIKMRKIKRKEKETPIIS